MLFTIIIIGLLLWICLEVLLFFTHIRPLNDTEIFLLAKKRREKFIQTSFRPEIGTLMPADWFKSSLDPDGAMYSVDIPLSQFPPFVAAMLKGKKHEWVVIGFEKDFTVTAFWTNKGNDKSSVSYSCDTSEILRYAKNNQYDSILRLHNHPNSDPQHYTCFLASDQDYFSAHSLGKIFNEAGINWLDYVCERGNVMQYYSSFAENYYPLPARASTIVSENGSSFWRNYKLHRELGFFGRNRLR